MTNSLAIMAAELEESNTARLNLEERVNDLALRLDTVGWEPADGWSEDEGMTLDALKRTSTMLRDMVATAPLLKRAVQLRHGYVFSRGITFKNTAPRHNAIMDDPYNKAALFSMPAYEELMAARMSDGNLFVLRTKNTNSPDFYRIPLKEISGVYTDPMSDERVWAIQRTWNEEDSRGNKKQKVEWYYTSTFKGKRQASIGGKPVNSKYDMIFTTFNRQVGFTWGVPDGYAAITWAIAYGEYLKNNSKLVKAYAQIAYKATTKTKAGGQNVSAQINATGGTAGTATMGQGTDLVPMPRAGSDVSFENGRPLAAMVAAALGVSVVALTADPGAAGSSYGSAQTLDAPTIIVMTSIQEGWRSFFEEVFRPITGKNGKAVSTEFPAIESDPVYRQLQSLSSAYSLGAIDQKEFRAAVLDLFDIAEADVAKLPIPDHFNSGHLTPEEAVKAKAVQSTGDPVSRQGNSGVTGDKGETNHDPDPDTYGNEN